MYKSHSDQKAPMLAIILFLLIHCLFILSFNILFHKVGLVVKPLKNRTSHRRVNILALWISGVIKYCQNVGGAKAI